ncbi:MAG TPA: TetR/AcrR family transcriptional regulator [Gammaproteobacteria bacterium]|nr:TetR/AcrR family transcriptional regulator [Gammaproteobacteria bacterium]
MKTRPTSVAADADNRSRLLHASADVFAEFGFEGASLRAIADAAGVSFQLIAYYFGSKEELWVATVDYLFERYLETGKGLGFTPSGNLNEQFHNHLRLLLTDMMQRPQLHKICVQEHLSSSPRYRNIIAPKLEHMFTTLAMPYFREVVRLGIVERFTPEEVCFLFSSICKANTAATDFVEQSLGVPARSVKAVEQQIDLIFAILTERTASIAEVEETPQRAPQSKAATRSPAATVATLPLGKLAAGQEERVEQLETENRNLKQLIGNLSLEKKLLLDRLAELESSAAKKR